jgi:uncharacterized repeat protein (TIGR01451 family)
MEKLIKSLGGVFCLSFIGVLIIPGAAFAATTPSLGAAMTYGVLSNTYANTVPGTTINGDVGFTTAPAVIPAGIHTNYGSGAPYATAGIDQGSALVNLNSQPCTFTFAPGAIDLSTDITHGAPGVYAPGVYCSTGAMNVGGPLNLLGNGTFIFRPDGALTSTAGAVVTLSGSSACDVFWTPTAATTLGANTTFAGTVIDDSAITVGANTTWLGRALAFGGTVTTDTDTITVPNCTLPIYHVIKQVVNDNGGTAVAGEFNLHVLLGGVDVVGSPAAGTVAPGTTYNLNRDTYTITEDVFAGYTTTFTGDCAVDGSITLDYGEEMTCNVINDDILAVLPATINVVKTVINDNGGTSVFGDFPLFVGGVPVVSGVSNIFAAPASYLVTETGSPTYAQSFSGDCDVNGNVNLIPGVDLFCIITNNDIPVAPVGGGGIGGGGGGGGTNSPIIPPVPPLINVLKVPDPLALPNGPGAVTYNYSLRNDGTVAVTDVTMLDDSCDSMVLNSGDNDDDNRLDVGEIWRYTCTSFLNETHTNTVLATGWANGISATDIASATVIVGLPIVPPLIHVEKIPSPLTLMAGGGLVTYTETVTNPGVVALSNVSLVDDKCSPMQFISGDTNNDQMLDPSESWVYTCSSNLSETTTNTAVATGEANGLTVRDFAIVTVVVAIAVPALPNAGLGFANGDSTGVMVAAGILTVILLGYGIVKKKSL